MAIPLHLTLTDDDGAAIKGSSRVLGREGSIVNPLDFQRLQAIIRSHKADLPIPGAAFKAYGTVTVW